MSRLPAVIAAVVAAAPCRADWIDDVTPSESLAPLWPADGTEVRQSPPDFHWPGPRPNVRYTLELEYPDGERRHLQVDRNWANWPEVLPPGRYRWRVTVSDGEREATGRAREFHVADDPSPFVVPPADELLERARKAQRPRSLPQRAAVQRLLGDRREGIDLLIARVREHAGATLPARADDWPEAQRDAALNESVQRAREALFGWAVAGEHELRDVAIARLDQLLGWDPDGASSYAANDQAARGITMTLALAWDWLHDRLDDARRARLQRILTARLQAMHADLFTTGERLSRFPLDSHRNHTLTQYAAACLLLAGDFPLADDALKRALPMALHWTSPWGEEDGGFANGSAYALWVNGDLQFAWQIIRDVAGVDVAAKPWLRGFARYLAYLQPPGVPAGVFGDAAERDLSEQRARTVQALSLFLDDDLSRWHAGALHGADYSRLQLLLAPPGRIRRAPLPEGTPDAAWFADAGVAALHSRLADPRRVSVFFRSSPYGSFNHGHADQNAFVIDSGGRRLAIDAGWFDAYGSEHWRRWYKTTAAHNAITCDGGRGQAVFEIDGALSPGRIARFEHRPDYDIVRGEATGACGGESRSASRTLVYQRPDLLFVYDRLEAATPRRWEWNLHAAGPFREGGDDWGWRTENGPESLCLRVLAGPEVTFSARDGAPAAPAAESQWHARLTIANPSTRFEMLTLLGVGCPAGDVSVATADGTISVTSGDLRLRFDGRTEVERPD